MDDEAEKELTALKVLCRYLKIDVSNLSTFSAVFQPINSVLLCDDCSSATNDFHELFQALEGIRLQLDLCVRQLHEFMEKGSKDLERVREYERRMTAGESINDLINSNISNNLRQKIVEKVCQKLKVSLPRIILDSSTGNIHEGVGGKAISSLPIPPTQAENTVEVVTEEDEGTGSPQSPIVSEQLPHEVDTENRANAENSVSSNQSVNQAVTLVEQPQIQPPQPPAASLLSRSKHKCSYCGKLLATTIGLKIHTAKQHITPKSTFKCDYCNGAFSFTQKHHLQAHLIRFHPASYFAGQLPAGISDQDFYDTLSDIVHKSQLSLECSREKSATQTAPPLECPHCRKRFKWMNALKFHISSWHLNEVIAVIRLRLY